MRIFIAVNIPEKLKSLFLGLQNKIDGTANIRFARDFHLTLKFLGEIDRKKLEEIKANLKEIKFKPFRINISRLGVFPTESYVKVVWVGLEPHDKISELQRAIDEKLSKVFPKDRRFHPHVTLGRVRFVKDKKAFIENIKNIRVEEKEFEVKKFRLKKSTLTPEGPIYEDLAVYEF